MGLGSRNWGFLSLGFLGIGFLGLGFFWGFLEVFLWMKVVKIGVFGEIWCYSVMLMLMSLRCLELSSVKVRTFRVKVF